MHTVMVVTIGLALLGACLLCGHLLGGNPGLARAALLFLPLWLLGAAINLAIGVRSAGYSLSDELPVFAVVFALPSLAALATWWRVH
jgi:hypothetical protein